MNFHYETIKSQLQLKVKRAVIVVSGLHGNALPCIMYILNSFLLTKRRIYILYLKCPTSKYTTCRSGIIAYPCKKSMP